MFSLVVKMLVSHNRVSRFESLLCSQFQLLAEFHYGMQQVMAQVTWLLPLTSQGGPSVSSWLLASAWYSSGIVANWAVI